jgi:AbrB family looped-hinge helix DNA binding protein
MGDRGRLVVPAQLRERLGLHAGSALLMLETPDGIVVATREQVKRLVRQQLAGASLVAELVADRRAAAARDDLP